MSIIQNSFIFCLLLCCLIACTATKEKSANTLTPVQAKKSLGEPISIDLKDKTISGSQKAVIETSGVNCFSKEVYDANQKDCSQEAQNWVCGCNNVSYPNECEAKKAGVKTFRRGKCVKEAKDI